MELDDSLTNEDLQDLHEDILDRNEDGVRCLLNEFRGVLLKKLCCTEVELEPAPDDHVINRRPLTAIHRAALIDSHGILDAILTSLDDVDIDLALRRCRYTPLHVASSAGVLAAVNYLTSSGASLVARDAEGRTPMHMAAENGHKDVVSLLCVRGASIIAHTYTDRTPLHLAARSGHLDIVEFLLSKGADPNVKDKDGRTPLHDAQVRGWPEISEALIERGADVIAADRNGHTPIHVWILNKGSRDKDCRPEYSNSFPALSALVNGGAEVNLRDQNGDTALHVAAETGDAALTEFLLNQRTSVSVLNNLGRTALFYAKSPDVASLLIEAGSEINHRDSRHDTALHVYASSDDVTLDVMEVAIRKGAEVDAQNCDGQTALHCACAASQRYKIELLLRSGARHDVMDRRAQAALHVTLSRGEPSLALWLLERIADVTNLDNQDKDGNSLLHLAARSGNVNVVSFLTSRRVALSLSNKSEQTPATLAAQYRHLDCLRHILLDGGTIDPDYGAAVLIPYVELGDLDMVDRLLDQRVDCNAKKDDRGRTAIHVALERELIQISVTLLDHGADVHSADNAKQSPLHVATCHLPAVEALLSRLVESRLRDALDCRGNAPLHYAISGCRVDTLTMLVGAGCRLNRKNDAGKTPPHCLLDSLSHTSGESVPESETLAKLDWACAECPECLSECDNDGDSLLHIAVRTGNIRILDTLLKHTPPLNLINKHRLTPLHCACANGHAKMASVLLEHGADVDVTDADGRSPIFHAVLSRDTDLVLRLLRSGADVNQRDVSGMTCLMVAMETQQSGLCEEVLLETTPDDSLVDGRGRSLLHYAARYCSRSVIDILLDQGADVTVRDASAMTPLHAASANDDDGVMASLLSSDVSIDARDKQGNTALHLSAERGSYGHVKRLLDHGADPEIANGVGRTAAHLAATVNDADVIELLIANEANIDVTDDEGNTPLALSIARGNVEISSDLLDQGADVTIRNASGDTVLHHAVRMSQLDRKLLQLLVRRCRGCLEAANSSGQTPLDILKSRTDLDLDGIALDMGLE